MPTTSQAINGHSTDIDMLARVMLLLLHIDDRWFLDVAALLDDADDDALLLLVSPFFLAVDCFGMPLSDGDAVDKAIG